MKSIISRAKALLAAVVVSFVPAIAMAQTAASPDVSEGAGTPIALIGGAVLLVLVGIKVFKWVRRAM
jgi:protein-S-isoprenylcysteine O-methyltransferase Ste14